jgi:glycosyltransferase involved in cell wall biosynthesis
LQCYLDKVRRYYIHKGEKTNMELKKLKILFITASPYAKGGISTWLRLMQSYMERKNDIEPVFIYPTYHKRVRNKPTVERTIWDRIFRNSYLMIFNIGKTIKLIIKQRPHVVHITTSGELAIIRDILFILTTKMFKLPTIYHIRFGRINKIAYNNTFEWKLISKAMLLVSEVMAIDNTTYNAVKKYLPSVNVVYIPNPIDVSNLPGPIMSNSKTIIFLGWVIKTKGIEELLSAWEKVYKANDDWRLRIVGPCKAEYLDYLKSHYSFEGVLYEGEKSHNEAMDLLNSSEIFILPSYTEGFPNAVLEAMALSKAIIATRVGAIPDMLSDDCGILIDLKEPEEIVIALKSLIADNKKRIDIGNNAYRKLCKEYTIETVFNRYLQEWEKLSK